jgi:hypothetical protein
MVRNFGRFAIFAWLLLSQQAALPAKPEHEKVRKWDSIRLSNGLIQINVTPELGGRILNYQLGSHMFLWSNAAREGQHPPKSRLGPGGTWLNWGAGASGLGQFR